MKEAGKAFLELVITDGNKPACAGVEPELFFPNYNNGGETTEALAKSVCRRCPISNACLEFALATGDTWAILGGMTPEERRALIRRNNTPATIVIPLEEAA